MLKLPPARRAASFAAAPLTEPVNTPARRCERHQEPAAGPTIDSVGERKRAARRPYLRSRWLTRSLFRNAEEIVDACATAWKRVAIDYGLVHTSRPAPNNY
jgi:hypothetical protein